MSYNGSSYFSTTKLILLFLLKIRPKTVIQHTWHWKEWLNVFPVCSVVKWTVYVRLRRQRANGGSYLVIHDLRVFLFVLFCFSQNYRLTSWGSQRYIVLLIWMSLCTLYCVQWSASRWWLTYWMHVQNQMKFNKTTKKCLMLKRMFNLWS